MHPSCGNPQRGFTKIVEMDAAGAVVFRAGRERVRPVDRLNDEVHGVSSRGES